MPISSNVSSTLDSTFSFGHCNCRGPKATSSKTVGLNNCTSGFWKTRATFLRNESAKPFWFRSSDVRRWPQKLTEPCDGKYSASRIRNRVDFPEPLAPSRAMLSPSATCSDSPRSAGMRSYSKLTFCNSKSSAKCGLPSYPAGDAGGAEKCQQPNIVPRLHAEVGEDADLSPKPSRLHREIDVVAEVDALAEQNARSPGCHAALFGALQPAHRSALARFKHLARRLDQKKDIPMRHRQHRDHLVWKMKRAQRLKHVRPRSTQDQQCGECHSGLHARNQEHRSCHTGPSDAKRTARKGRDWIARSYENRGKRYNSGEGQNDQPHALGERADADSGKDCNHHRRHEQHEHDRKPARERDCQNKRKQANYPDSRVE